MAKTMFGPYQLLERLGAGGMAEVFLARKTGPGGVSQYVALKRLLNAETKDKELATMFLDEAKLAVLLKHPNLVQVNDFGIEKDIYFLAIEFIEGQDLRQVLMKAESTSSPIPIECCLYILACVARGLDYAHKLTDPQGRALEIVHRDVSPANILMSYRGDAKLSDFGIARAAEHLRSNRTEAGALKGKIRYMSPEQARGEPLDGRSDLFALGTVLLEMITLKPAFKAASELQSLHQVQSGRPGNWEELKTKIPEDVLPIIEKAMSAKLEDRYVSGEALAEACEIVLRTRNPGFSPNKLSAYVESLFSQERSRWRERMKRYDTGEDDLGGAQSITMDAEATGITNTGTSTATQSATIDAIPSEDSTRAKIVDVTGTGTGLGAPNSGTLSRGEQVSLSGTEGKKSSTMMYVLGGVGLAAAAAGMLIMANRQQPTPPPVAAAASPSPSPVAPAKVDNTGKLTFMMTNTANTEVKVYLDKSATEKSTAPVATGHSLVRATLPAEQEVFLRVEAEGFKPITTPLTLTAGEALTLPITMVSVNDSRPAQVIVRRPSSSSSNGGSTPKTTPTGKPEKPSLPDQRKNENFIDPFK